MDLTGWYLRYKDEFSSGVALSYTKNHLSLIVLGKNLLECSHVLYPSSENIFKSHKVSGNLIRMLTYRSLQEYAESPDKVPNDRPSEKLLSAVGYRKTLAKFTRSDTPTYDSWLSLLNTDRDQVAVHLATLDPELIRIFEKNFSLKNILLWEAYRAEADSWNHSVPAPEESTLEVLSFHYAYFRSCEGMSEKAYAKHQALYESISTIVEKKAAHFAHAEKADLFRNILNERLQMFKRGREVSAKREKIEFETRTNKKRIPIEGPLEDPPELRPPEIVDYNPYNLPLMN